jgi:MFS transporter, FHS family, L-fucose permease
MASGPVIKPAPDTATATSSSTGLGIDYGKGKGPKPNYTVALTTLTMLFFMMGFITCMNDIIIPYFKKIFSLTYAEAMLVQLCFFASYFVVSMPSGYLIQKIGYKKSIIIGFSVAALGCFLFYPSADLQSYPLFLASLFILASGIVVLQVAGNPYVAILGKPETASSRLTLTQAFNSLGTTIAPLLGSFLILSQLESNPDTATGVQMPYLVLCAIMLIIALIISFIKLPAMQPESANLKLSQGEESKSALSFSHLRLGAIAIFTYVGAEVAIGSFMVNYFELPSVANLAETEAGKLLSFYWGGAMVGRFLGAYLLTLIKPSRVLIFNALIAIILIAVSVSTSGVVAMWAMLGVGLFNSIMFATIFTLAVDNLGKFTNQGSGILCTAIVGGAIIPWVQGYAADQIGLHLSYIIPIVCYLYIAWYGISGYKQKKA